MSGMKRRKNFHRSETRVKKRVQRCYSLQEKLNMIKLRDKNMSYADIARRLEVPVTTVKTIIARKQKILTDCEIAKQDEFVDKACTKSVTSPNEVARRLNSDVKPTWLAEVNHSLKEKRYCARQVFNVTAAFLNWKDIQTITGREVLHGDTVTILLGSNAQGDFKIKPLLVNHLENPPEMIERNKALLPVIWSSHPDICITKDVLSNWFTGAFKPAVEMYLLEQNLAYKILLLLDESLREIFDEVMILENPTIEIIFVPLTQDASSPPMQQVLSVFEQYYMYRLMTQAVSSIDIGESSNLDEFMDNYNIWKATYTIADSWTDVKPATINKSWINLCPQFVCEDQQITEDKTIIEQISELRTRLLQEQTILKSETENCNMTLKDENVSEIAIETQKLIDVINKQDPDKQRAAEVVRNIQRELACYFQEDFKTNFYKHEDF